jgi:hypothetical protein
MPEKSIFPARFPFGCGDVVENKNAMNKLEKLCNL